MRAERRQRFEELKRLHRPQKERRFGWTQGVGVLLMGVAMWTALDPDYPIPRELARPASASGRVYLLPEGRSPDVSVPVSEWRFAWSWDGPEVVWHLVLLGPDFVPCASMTEIHGLEVSPNAVLQQAVRNGEARYWFVGAALEGLAFRSMPLPLPLPATGEPETWGGLPFGEPAAPR